MDRWQRSGGRGRSATAETKAAAMPNPEARLRQEKHESKSTAQPSASGRPGDFAVRAARGKPNKKNGGGS
jgi:hypothetical protein